MEQGIPALVADNQMRQRDERFEGQGKHKAKDDVLYKTCLCPAGQTLRSPGGIYTTRTGVRYQVFSAKAAHYQSCAPRTQCLKSGSSERGQAGEPVRAQSQRPVQPQ